MKRQNNKRGFTLIELIVVISVLAILATVGVSLYTRILHRAENSIALGNINIIRKFITGTIISEEFTEEETFTYIQNKSTPEHSVNYLSRYVEVNWEYLGEPGDYDNANYISIENPQSDKVGIVNWSNVVSLCNNNSLYRKQALYISDSNYLSYTPGSPKTFDLDYFNSALVMWYDKAVADHIYFYYVNENGTQSDNYYVLDNPHNE